MLVLTRRVGESVRIGDDIYITVTRLDRGNVRLGISAPASLRIDRQEVRARIEAKRRIA